MKRSYFTMALAALITGSSATAQSVDKQLDKLAKDPRTAEHAAKADVYILGKQIAPAAQTEATRPKSETARKKKKSGKKKQ